MTATACLARGPSSFGRSFFLLIYVKTAEGMTADIKTAGDRSGIFDADGQKPPEHRQRVFRYHGSRSGAGSDSAPTVGNGSVSGRPPSTAGSSIGAFSPMNGATSDVEGVYATAQPVFS